MSKNIYLLSPTQVEGALHLPMIEFVLIEEDIDFSLYDGIIFTSKQGVVALDNITSGAWKSTPAAVIGKMTAKEVEKRGGEVIFISSKAYADILAKELASKFVSYKWLYPRPKVVVSKIAQELKGLGIDVEEKIIYKTECKKYEQRNAPKENSVLVFTSPSTVKCFFQNFRWRASYTAVAIGEKSAQAFQTFKEDIKVFISPSQSIKSAIEFAKTLSSD